MAKRIVLPALAPSIPTGELVTLTTDYLGNMGIFFDMVRRQISAANNTNLDGIEFLVKGASAETFRFGGALSKMTNQHVGGEGPGEIKASDSLTDEDHNRIELELIRASDLVFLAAERARNGADSELQTLLAAIKDRVRSVEKHLGIPPRDEMSA